MSDFKLNFKASNIAKAEDKTNKNFFGAMARISDTPSLSDLMFLFQAGGATEDEFDEALKGGLEQAMVIITEGLNESGFLAEKIDLEEMKQSLKEAKERKQRTSKTTGNGNSL